jgi:hypothetical protein
MQIILSCGTIQRKNATNQLTAGQARSYSAGLSGEKMTQKVGSDEVRYHFHY